MADHGATPPSVTVVIPTFRSGERLRRPLDSLRAQTLGSDRIEILVIDDGSPAEDAAVIADLVSGLPNARFHRIEHSGWPSRPRNVGIDLAIGDYILFVDHDDELYPDSLAIALDTLARTGADVFAGKEARTDQAKWGLDAFDGNHDAAELRTDVHPLVPTNPHKLYRTRMLREHGIRFPEGGRQLWEDVLFNADVARHSPRVSIRSDEPFYHWVREGRTTSTSFGEDADEWWSALTRVVEHVDGALSGDGNELQRRLLVGLQFRDRVLPALGPSLLRRTEAERTEILARARHLVVDFLDDEVQQSLPRHLAARAQLLRLGRPDLVLALARYDDGIAGITFARSVVVDATIRLETTTKWFANRGGFLDLVVAGGQVRRALSPDLEEALDPSYLLLDDDLAAASSRIGLRSRDSRMTWLVPTETTVGVSDDPFYPDVTARSTALIDPDSLRYGLPMADGYWDFNARNELFGVVNHRAIRAVGVNGRAQRSRNLRVYQNVHDKLSLQIS
ncbi:glycosyltransferase family 2 protein [Agromyces sp. NPDC057679]|uniref:glycosyltransferase family 2 protein n=1 Tax=Agromyces sp. NPDC057679 TaxID=3346207 RepID=UPI003672FE8E